MIEIFLTTFTVFFVIIDPLGIVPIFITLTEGSDKKHKKKMAIKASIIGFCVLIFFAIVGDKLFRALGIEMYAFRICGGAMLFLTALDMVFERRTQKRSDSANKVVEAKDFEDISVFPIAIPLLAGPGAITSLILILSKYDGNITNQIIVFAVIAIVIMICLILLLSASFIEKIMGHTVTNIISRIFGIILAALSVQFIIDGIRGAFLGA